MAARLLLLIPSFSLLAGAALLLNIAGNLTTEYQTVITLIPYLLTLVAALLGYGFNRSQVVLGALNLCCAYFLIQTGLQTSLDEAHTYVLFSLLSLLLPLHTGLIAAYQERGLITPYGISRIAGVVITYLLLYISWENRSLGYLLADLPMITLEMLRHDLYLSQAATIILSLALIPAGLAMWFRKTYTEAAILSSLFSAALLLALFDKPLVSSLFVSASLIALCISVMQTSHDMAYLDELTEIPARRALMTKFATLGRHYSVAMMDVDHFKKFNDTYGHDIGDQVLRMVAAQINKVSGGGKAFRYGGEEFTVVFAGKSEQECMMYLEEVRERIAHYQMHIRNKNRPDDNTEGKEHRNNEPETEIVHVEISIGVAEKTDHHQGPMDVMKTADEALYAAKEGGRNRTVASRQAQTPKAPPKKAPAKKPAAASGAKKDFAN